MGGGGGLLGGVTDALFGSPPSPPPAPDYVGAAQTTAAGNLAAAQAATSANRVSQYTPYGNLVYSQNGVDSQGNPTWQAVTSLNGTGQQLLDTQNQTSLGLGQTINAQLGNVQRTMGQGFNPQTGPITNNVGQANLNQLTGQANLSQVGQGPQFNQIGQAQNLQTNPNYASGMQGWDQANQILQARLQPQMAQDKESQAASLANQGIVQGTKAYDNAMRTFNQGQNDLLTNSQLAGQQIGNSLFNQGITGGQFTNSALTQQNQNQLANIGFNNNTSQQGYANTLAAQQANNAASQQGYQNSQTQQQANNALAQQQFGNQLSNANLGNQAQQQQYTQAMTNYNMPLNTLSALRSGAQVQNPTFQNVPQQATTSGADVLGATTAAGNYNLGTYNANAAQQAGMTSGLMGLGGSLGAAAIISDIRTKEHIKEIGMLHNGLPVYEYEYKPEWKAEAGHGKFIGVMAHEVEAVMPEAVITRLDGYKMVNYGVLNG